ncbi:MAG: peroxiredoxin [Candidatus Pacebacteria bacterium]|nr:peroxiredoxin [Candidatus Paceibacterota bacterium]
MLTKNSPAPLDISVSDQDGNLANLKSQLGHYTVLYFYPKDDTPGCTKEACSFRDAEAEMQKLGVTVIGISPDKPESHQKFQKKYSLSFPLWSDPDHKLAEAFGAWGGKILRSTFIIDSKGKIAAVWPKVKPAEHATEVLEFLRLNLL